MKDLKSFFLVTEVEEFIDADLITDDLPPAKRAKYDGRYYTLVEWKTGFTNHSLQYLTEVWEEFSCHYLIPDSPPTAVFAGIVSQSHIRPDPITYQES